MAAVAPREGERLEQPKQQLIEHGAVVSADLAAQGACNSALAVAGRADDEQILMPVDPLVGDEFLEQPLVEPARCLHVDILDDGVLPEAGEPQPERPAACSRARSPHGRPAVRGARREPRDCETKACEMPPGDCRCASKSKTWHDRQQSDRCGFGPG